MIPARLVPALRPRLALVALMLVCPRAVLAQGAGVAIERNRLSMKDSALVAKAQALRDQGKLMDKQKVIAAMKSPAAVDLKLPAANKQKLEPREIAARARKALVRVGWFFLCPRCEKLHVNVAGGYALTADGVVATCWHVVAPEKQDMREGHLIAIDAEGNALPVTAVLGFDRELDTAIIRVGGGSLAPLPLNDESGLGDAVFLFSDPLEFAGYFSSGIINRFYWKDDHRPADARTLAGARHLRVNVSTDWAPGSSGAAVLDACGNAIGHVSMINALSDDKPAAPAAPQKGRSAPRGATETMIVLHEAVPARGVKLLIEEMGKPAANGGKKP